MATVETLADLWLLDTLALAQRLVGAQLKVAGVGGMIVETEAYRIDDPASHSFTGPTKRNATMFGPPGRAYVYRSYGLHWCLNVVAGETGGAVLLRAIEPTFAIETMQKRRGLSNVRLLCAGPGRLCQALGIDVSLDGRRLDAPPFELLPGPEAVVDASKRIGISRAMDQPWRFTLRGSHFLSRPVQRS